MQRSLDMADRESAVRVVSLTMSLVVGLSFVFGFGNVLNLALQLGVPVFVAPLVAPAVDLSVLGLLWGTRYLALRGASHEQIRPARRLLLFTSTVTLALNVAAPLVAGQLGKAAFEAVAPLLLIGWAEVGPSLLQALAITTQSTPDKPTPDNNEDSVDDPRIPMQDITSGRDTEEGTVTVLTPSPDDITKRALALDEQHWKLHGRPISAETLRRELHIGSTRARGLVRQIRRRGYPAVANLTAQIG